MVMVRYMILLLLSCLGLGSVSAQTTGDLQGKVLDDNGEPLSYANVALYKGDNLVRGTSTDFDGLYNFSNIEAGTYDLVVSYVGLPTKKTTDVRIKTGQTMNYDVSYSAEEITTAMDADTSDGPVVIVTAFKIPLIELDNTSSGQTLGSEDIAKLATRSISSIKATTAGISQKDEGEATNANGSRSSSDDTYVDGVRVIGGAASIPETEIDQIQIITSGIPSEFGDATGAITNIITKGPSAQVSGGIQLETSQFLDPFAASTIDVSIGGPILSKVQLNADGDTLRKDGKVKRTAILGYRIAARYATNLDSRPSALGSFRLTEEREAAILANPLLTSPSGVGRISAAESLTADDLVPTAVRPNGRNSTSLATIKLDYKPNQDFYFVAGGQGQFDWGNNPAIANRLFNSAFNQFYTASNWRVYGRFRHTISNTIYNAEAGDSTSIPVFQNFSYEIQGDYTQSDSKSYDPRFEERMWEYGYVGQIRRSQAPVVGVIDTNYILNSVGDTLGTEQVLGHAFNRTSFNGYTSAREVGFDGGLSNYNNVTDFSTVTDMELMEVINGRFTTTANSVFGLFNNSYNTGNGFGKANSTQIRGTVKANFDLVTNKGKVRHSIQLGGVYEQRVNRSYNLNPFSLWTLADQSANSHISNAADPSKPILDANGNATVFFDPFSQRYYTQNQSLIRTDEEGNTVQMSAFGENVRNSLGKDPQDWVNVHELSPNDMQMSWFDPTTLITGAQQLVTYYGYDYLGNPLGTNVAYNDFFNATDANGRKTRPIAPFAPIYVAGYIQDKFKYKDIIFRLGVRFDSYDANTKVLKDPYSVSGYYTASEFENTSSGYNAAQLQGYVRPSNIGNDYAVYVNDNSPDATILGYRNGEQWYDASGLAVNAPTQLGSIVLPALRGFSTAINDPQGDEYNPDNSFRDYTPSLIVMIRLKS